MAKKLSVLKPQKLRNLSPFLLLFSCNNFVTNFLIKTFSEKSLSVVLMSHLLQFLKNCQKECNQISSSTRTSDNASVVNFRMREAFDACFIH